MGNTRKPGGGRKPSKPEYSAERNLVQQMEAAVLLYKDGMTLQAITDALSLNPIKVRKLLITAGVYESDTAKLVQQTFNAFRETQDYSTAVTSTMSALQLSRPSVTSYLPYEKGVYFPEEAEAANISAGAERQRHYRAVVALRKDPCEENLWKCVVAFRGYKFKTLSGLPFTYKLKKGRGDEFTKELWIDRREDSKSLAWSSVMLAYHNIAKIGEVSGLVNDSVGYSLGAVSQRTELAPELRQTMETQLKSVNGSVAVQTVGTEMLDFLYDCWTSIKM